MSKGNLDMEYLDTTESYASYIGFVDNRPFSHCKFPSSLRLLGNTNR